VLVAVAKPVLMDTLDPDCFWHLRVAQALLRDGIGPLVDDISFGSIREPWTPYSWLAELGMLGVWNVAGWQGAVAVHAIMSAAFVLLIAACCREMQRMQDRRGELNAVLATAAACVWSLAYFSFRPATLAIVLLALCAYLIIRDRRLHERSRAIWLVLPLGVLLTNVHLTALILPLWLGAMTAGALWERFRAADRSDPELARRSMRYTLLACLSGLAYLATPMLPGALQMLGKLQFEDAMVAMPILGEMRPFYDGAFGKVSLLLVVLTVVSCWTNRKQIRAGEWFWLAGMMVFLFRLGRFAPLFAIIAAPLAAAFWPRLSDRPLRRRPIAVALAALIAIGGLRVIVNFPTPSTQLDPWLNRNVPAANGYPAGAAAFVDANVQPKSHRLINELNWGGYLAWRLDRYQNFIDGRTQMHPPQFFRDVFLGDEPTRRALIEGTHADAAILPKKGSVFHASLLKLGWTVAWEDEQSLVLLPPTTTAFQPLD
jgi:hypothetical protein